MEERNTLQVICIFFQPIKYRKKEYFKQLIQAILTGVNAVIHVLFLERIVHFLE
jgi:hypothetical protein